MRPKSCPEVVLGTLFKGLGGWGYLGRDLGGLEGSPGIIWGSLGLFWEPLEIHRGPFGSHLGCLEAVLEHRMLDFVAMCEMHKNLKKT